MRQFLLVRYWPMELFKISYCIFTFAIAIVNLIEIFKIIYES